MFKLYSLILVKLDLIIHRKYFSFSLWWPLRLNCRGVSRSSRFRECDRVQTLSRSWRLLCVLADCFYTHRCILRLCLCFVSPHSCLESKDYQIAMWQSAILSSNVSQRSRKCCGATEKSDPSKNENKMQPFPLWLQNICQNNRHMMFGPSEDLLVVLIFMSRQEYNHHMTQWIKWMKMNTTPVHPICTCFSSSTVKCHHFNFTTMWLEVDQPSFNMPLLLWLPPDIHRSKLA